MENVNNTNHAVYALKLSDDSALYIICVFIQLIAIGFALAEPLFSNTILMAGFFFTSKLMSKAVANYCSYLKKGSDYPYLLAGIATLFWLPVFPFLLLAHYLKSRARS